VEVLSCQIAQHGVGLVGGGRVSRGETDGAACGWVSWTVR
jgi:hypothetical protein